MIQGRRPESLGGLADVDQQNRTRYDRNQLRYPSDLTDAEWAHVEPLIPPASAAATDVMSMSAKSSTA